MNLLKIKHNLVLEILLDEIKIGDGHSKNTSGQGPGQLKVPLHV